MKPKLAMVALCFLILTSGCVQPNTPPLEPTAIPLTGEITFVGSTTVQPLAAKIGEAFNEHHPDVTLDIAAGGSNVGIKAIHDGSVDIGMASRKLKAEEAKGMNVYQIAVDVLAVIVNESNPVQVLSSEQLKGIYLGEITNWREVGGEDKTIVVVIRESSSGTRGAFDEIVLSKKEPSAPELEITITAGDMAATVLATPNAIGYVGFGNIEPGLKTLAIDGITPSEESAKNGNYQLVRPLQLLIGPLSQPIAQNFIDFALDEQGQQIVEDNGWVPVQ